LKRIKSLQGIGVGRRAFLVGNGPSINRLDLAKLEGEFVCLTNRGLRALGERLDHADMHIVNDIHCYRVFGREIEEIVSKNPIRYRFLNTRMRRRWRRMAQGPTPHFLIGNPQKLVSGNPVPDLSGGVVTGPSILLSAVHLLDYMGFSELYVIGCDLDYESTGPYFFRLNELDIANEQNPDIIARRQDIAKVNEQFAILRTHLERSGGRICNAGGGGNLESLPRVNFADLFVRER
jgi:hypothetical protein